MQHIWDKSGYPQPQMPFQMLQIHAHEQVPSWFPKASKHDLVALDFEESRAHYGMFESPIFTFTSTSFLKAQLLKNPPAMQEILVRFLGREDRLKRDRLPTPVFLGFPCSAGKRILLQCGRPGFDPWVGEIPGERKGYPLQYSGLEKSMDY